MLVPWGHSLFTRFICLLWHCIVPLWGCTPLFEKDWYIRILLRTVQAGNENCNQLLKNLYRLFRKNLGSFMQVSSVSPVPIIFINPANICVCMLVCPYIHPSISICSILSADRFLQRIMEKNSCLLSKITKDTCGKKFFSSILQLIMKDAGCLCHALCSGHSTTQQNT